MASDGYSLGKAHWGGGRQGGSSEEAASGKSFLRGKPDLGLEGCVGALCEKKRGKLLECGEKSQKSTLDVWGWMEIE